MRFGCRMSIRYANDVGQTGDGREIDKEGSASNAGRLLRAYTDAKSADSSFSDLTKPCQRIRSISMRKGQISPVLLDRVPALQGRGVI